jgi:hypothetical protein
MKLYSRAHRIRLDGAHVEDAPEIFLPIPGGWERWGTRIMRQLKEPRVPKLLKL